MSTLRPYPKYKAVDLPWLKEIPSHWELKKIRSHFSERKTKVSDKDFTPLSVAKQGVVPQLESACKTDDGNNRKLVKSGDFVINSRSDRKGSSGLSTLEGSVSLINIVLCPRNICRSFVEYLLKSNSFIEEFYRNGRGIVADLWTTRYQDMRNISIPVPPRDEQEKIVAFLDEETAKIDKYIEAKHRYFELVLEKLVSKIFRKSLSKKIAPWSSLFPDKWERKQVKRLFEEVSLKGFPEEELAAVTQDRGVVLKRDCSQNYVSPDGNYEKQKLIRPNDFVISLRSFEGGIEYSSLRGLVSSAYNIFCLREKYNNKEMIEFYRIMFKSKPFISLLNTFTNTIRDGKDISFKDISRVELPIPDKKFLNDFYKRVKIYRITVSNFEKIRKLLIEYKTRLISDAVTGKIEV